MVVELLIIGTGLIDHRVICEFAEDPNELGIRLVQCAIGIPEPVHLPMQFLEHAVPLSFLGIEIGTHACAGPEYVLSQSTRQSLPNGVLAHSLCNWFEEASKSLTA